MCRWPMRINNRTMPSDSTTLQLTVCSLGNLINLTRSFQPCCGKSPLIKLEPAPISSKLAAFSKASRRNTYQNLDAISRFAAKSRHTVRSIVKLYVENVLSDWQQKSTIYFRTCFQVNFLLTCGAINVPLPPPIWGALVDLLSVMSEATVSGGRSYGVESYCSLVLLI